MRGKRTTVTPISAAQAPPHWHRFMRLARYLHELFGDDVVIESDDLPPLPDGEVGVVHLEFKPGAVIVHEGPPDANDPRFKKEK